MLVKLKLVEQRYQAALEVMEGASVTGVAQRFGVTRQTVHVWLHRYAAHGLAGLADKGSTPLSCPHQMTPEAEARIAEGRPNRINAASGFELSSRYRVQIVKRVPGLDPAERGDVDSVRASRASAEGTWESAVSRSPVAC
jgi:transposase-like protein